MKKEKQIVLNLPDFIEHNGRTVSIDESLVTVIKALWKAKIITMGCCSGHGKETPSIIVSGIKTGKDVDKIKKILDNNFHNNVEILQWTLIPILRKFLTK